MSLPDLSVSSREVSFVPSVVYKGVSNIIRAVIRNLGEAPVSSFIVRFLAEGAFLTDRSVSLNGESSVSVDASWTPVGNGTSNVSVLIDPLHALTESSKDNNRADMSVFVLPDRPYPPDPGDQTTTTLNGSCVMPGNTLPCDVVSLEEVVAGITSWSKGNIELNERVTVERVFSCLFDSVYHIGIYMGFRGFICGVYRVFVLVEGAACTDVINWRNPIY